MNNEELTLETFLGAIDSQSQQTTVPLASLTTYNIEQYFYMFDAGLREIFLRENEGKLKFNTDENKWYGYDEIKGLWSTKVNVVKASDKVAKAIREYQKNHGISDISNKALNSACRSSVMKNVRADAKEFMKAESDDFDTDKYKLHCQNGVIDLKTGELFPHSPDYKFSISTGINYIKDAPEPKFFTSLLWKMHKRNSENIPILLRELGRSLLGFNQFNSCYLTKGEGGNGKSTLFNCVAEALGGYYQMLSKDALTIPRWGKNSFNDSLHRKRKARILTLPEPSTKGHLDESMLKVLTGETKVDSRACGKSGQTWVNQSSLFILFNDIPHFNSKDQALQRRFMLFPMLENISAQPDCLSQDEVERLSVDEREQVLSLLVRECVMAQSFGMPRTTPSMDQAKNQLFIQHNPIEEFIKEYCKVERGATYHRPTMFKDFESFCRSKNIKNPYGKNSFYEELGKAHGFEARKTNGDFYFRGIGPS